MARVIPSGTTDYTTQIAMREAAANDALHRLYVTLAARREERMRQQEFMEKMLEMKHGYTEKLYDKYGAPGTRGGNPNFSTWSPPVVEGDGDNPLADNGGADTGAAAPQTQQPKRPFVGPNPDAFTPDPQKSGALPVDRISEAATAMAQAPGKGETTTLSAQTIFGKPPAPMKTTGTKTVAARKEDYRYIGPNTMKSWNDAERRNGLPPGTLLTVLGLENAGGYKVGANPRSQGGASGLFQTTPEWRRDWRVSEGDQLNAVKMGDAVAASIARTKANIEAQIGRKLGDTPKDMAALYIGHMWGVGNGPRINAAYAKSPDTPMRQILLPSRAKDGGVVSPMQTLANNGLPVDITVKRYVEQELYPRVQNWHGKALVRLQNQPVAPSEIPRNTTGVAVGTPTTVPQGANFAGRGAGAQYKFGDTANMIAVPVPDGSGRTVVVHKDVAPIAHGFLKDMIDAGAPLTSISGYVPKNIKGTRTPSQHGFGFSIDMSQQGRNQVSKEYRDWAIANKDTLGRILAKWQVRSGGDWRNPDFGHIEFGPEALAAYKNRQAQPQVAAAPATPPIPPRKPMDYDKTGASPFAGIVAGEKAQVSPSLPAVADADIFFDKSMRRPSAIAASTPTPAPSSAPPPAIKNVPPEVSGAVSAPTPQTQQPLEQPTQAVPAPTQQQVETDSGYTVDDMNETAATRLSKGEPIPLPPTKPPISMGGPSRSLRDLPPNVDVNSGAPLLEALGQGARDIRGAASDIMGDIGGAAKDIGGDILWAAGDISKDIRSVDPMSDVVDAAGDVAAPLLSGAGQVARDIRSVDPMSDVAQGMGDMISDAGGAIKRGLQTPYKPSYNIPPQIQRLLEQKSAQQGAPEIASPPSTLPTTQPLPVPASEVADAMYNVTPGEGIPSYGQTIGGTGKTGMGWIEKLFHREPDTSPVKARPVKTQGIKLTPGGAPYMQPQPPMQLGPQGTPMQVTPQAGGQVITTPQGQLEMQYDENGMPVFRPMVQ